jgi:type I restriction enzyme R subunit
MIDHFHRDVKHLINGEAKTMIVTKSIIAAIKYKQAFDEYLKEIKSPYKAIVAFSGKKTEYKGS